MTENRTKLRLTVLGVLIAFLFASLSTRLWFLQVLANQQFSDRAQNNRVRVLPEDAPRGRILDRHGHLLVENRPSTIITIDRSKLGKDDRDRVLARLSQLVHIDTAELEARLADQRYYAYQPVPVAFDVRDAAALYIGEHNTDFPGVSVQVGPVREYPQKKLAAHLLGYTGEISAGDLKLPQFKAYTQGTLIGQAGVERTYERDLQGVKGLVNYEVNAQGQIRQQLGERAPVPGNDLVLSLDADAQKIAEQSLAEGIRLARSIPDKESGKYLHAGGGAVIVMDPRNGQILALASNPTFNPSDFVGGITTRDLKRLTNPDANFPLLDRAVQSAYPPGSTFKPFVAAAALKQGITHLYDYTDCPAEFSVPNDPSGTVFHNWRPANSGRISLATALIESCDTVFYQFGYRFNAYRAYGEPFQKQLRQFDFGSATGIDLPSETDGRIPDAAWKKEVAKTNKFIEKYWLPGDDINMAIGQGNVTVSPLQLAVAYSAIANGGTLYAPRLGLRVQTATGRVIRKIPPKVVGHVPFTKYLPYIREALRGVVQHGTAATAFLGFPLDRFPVAGKTGTAEIKPKQPYSWFAAMAPADHPRYVVISVIEEGGHGSTTAAPVVRRILEGLFGIGIAGGLQNGGVVD